MLQVQWGVLASAAGRLECCVVKIYDRAISQANNLKLRFLRTLGDCDIHVLFIRGKQLGTNADPTGAEAIAHGGVEEHADETAVAAKIFTEVVAEKIEKRKAQYAVIMRQIHENGFQGKMGSPEMQRLVTAEIEAQRVRALESHGSFISDPDMILEEAGRFDGFSSSDEEAPRVQSFHQSPSTPAFHQSPSTPASAAPLRRSGQSSSSSSSDSESGGGGSGDDGSDSSNAPSAPLPGMGTYTSCAHLQDTLHVQHHIHAIHKTEQRGEYECAVCLGKGVGGMVYACEQCQGWCAHLRCVLPQDKRQDTSMIFHEDAVSQLYALPDQAFAERAVLILDGCNGQVRAAVGTPDKPGVLSTIFFPKGIDIIKGSAQCSPSQNPLDCMRSFMNVKRYMGIVAWLLFFCH
jgi:hypothetical protein